MARHFLRLKIALLRNALRASWQQRLGLIFGVVFVLPLALWGFVLFLIAGQSGEHGEALAVIAFVLLFVGWLILPMLGFASDETLDPARLSLLPLTAPRLVAGLFVASSVGLAPVATLVALAGAVVGFAAVGAGALLAVAAVLVEFALCIVGSRAVTTALSGILRSRRGRDVLVVAGALLGIAFAAVWNVMLYLVEARESVRGVDLAPLVDVLGWLPPGLAARALVDSGRGDLAAAAWELGLAGLAVVVLALVWSAAIARALTTAAGSRTKRRDAVSHLFPRLARFLPRDRRGAVAAKELRYWAREPRLRATSLGVSVFAMAPIAPVVLAEALRRPEAVLLAPASLWLASLVALNQFGVDGPAAWTNVVAAGRTRDDIVGKNIAFSLVMLPLVALIAIVLAALTGGWVYVALALGVAAGVLGAAVAVGNVVSVRAPIPAASTTTNTWATAGAATGFYAMFVQLLATAVLGVLLLPLVVWLVVGLVTSASVLVALAVVAVPYGWGLWRIGVLVADERLRFGEPELLDALTPSRQ